MALDVLGFSHTGAPSTSAQITPGETAGQHGDDVACWWWEALERSHDPALRSLSQATTTARSRALLVRASREVEAVMRAAAAGGDEVVKQTLDHRASKRDMACAEARAERLPVNLVPAFEISFAAAGK